MFTDVVKDAGATAAHELRETAKESIHTVDTETIPAAQAAAAALIDRASTAFVTAAADLANRADGANCPIKGKVTITIDVDVMLGPVRVPAQDYDATVKPSVEVKG